jgi:hypothetical protein
MSSCEPIAATTIPAKARHAGDEAGLNRLDPHPTA